MTSGNHDDMPRRAADWYRGTGLLERVREHPIPAAVAVGSLAWLAFARRPSRDYSGPPPYDRWSDPDVLYRGRSSERYPDTTGDDAEERSRSSVVSRSVGSRARDAASAAGQRVGEIGSQTQRRVQQMARENTLTAALLAAGLGIAIGLALPETERENELMGDAKTSVVNRAKSAARGAVEQVQQTANDVQRVTADAIGSIEGESRQPRKRHSSPG